VGGAITVKRIIEGYKKSPDRFLDRAQSTQDAYSKVYLPRIEEKFGAFTDLAFRPKTWVKTRRVIQDWHNELVAIHGPAGAKYTVKVFRSLLEYARFVGDIEVNPIEEIAYAYKEANRTEKLWTEEHCAEAYKLAPGRFAIGMGLGEWCGQRPSDNVRMRFGKGEKGQPYYDTRTKYLHIRQLKTDEMVVFKAPDVIRDILDAIWERRQAIGSDEVRVMLNSWGRPWTNRAFGHAFTRWKNEVLDDHPTLGSEFRDLHYNDLRGTAATRLRTAGCTDAQIASITGHKESSIKTLVERYLGGRRMIADQAHATSHANADYMAAQASTRAHFPLALVP
jgi:integrase